MMFRVLRNNIIPLLILSLFLFASFGVVFAEDEYSEQIDQKESELEESKNKQYSYQQEGLSVSQKLDALSLDLSGIESDIAGNESSMQDLQTQIDTKNAEVESKKIKTSEVSQSLYKMSRTNLLDVLLSANGVSDLLNRIGFQKFGISNLLGQMRQLGSELLNFSSQYDDLKAQLDVKRADLSKLQEDKIALENQKALYEQLVAEEAARQEQLTDEIADLTEEAEEAIREKTGGQETPPGGGGGDNGGGTSPQDPMGDPGSYAIYQNGNLIVDNAAGPIRAVPTGSNVFSVDGGIGQYRGILEFRADTNVYVINELSLEMYLRGIGEMSSSWPIEALKAQAVAARTYAAANWNKRADLGYNLRDDTYDQNYVGYSKESSWYGENWVSAVDSTSGQIIYADGSPISAYYHSTCGGHTLSAEEVWGGGRSYAQAESDWYDAGGGWQSYDGDSPWSYKRWGSTNIDINQLQDLLNAGIWLEINGASAESQNNVIRPDLGPGWNADQLNAALGANSVTSRVGSIQSATQIYNTGGGSINSDVRLTQSIRVTGTSGTIDISGGMFKLAFNLRSPGDDVMFSSLWDVVYEGGSYNFYSRGYPHRIGMCQYGAYGRANAGQGYSDILTHYYRGTNIAGFSAPANFRVGITYVGGPTTLVSADGTFDIYANGEKVASGNSGETWSIAKK